MQLIFTLGIQPPNHKALPITAGFLGLTALVWFAFERRRFKGPPQGTMIQNRFDEIREAEKAVGETGGIGSIPTVGSRFKHLR
jgi:hypothetical protein